MIIPDDRTNLNARLTVMQVGLGVMFFVLVVSFWAIQVLQHDKFLEEAENNHTREIPLRAPRGAMFDRHGKVLVENREALQHLAGPRAGAEPRSLDAAAGGGDRRSRSATSATSSIAAARCRAYQPIRVRGGRDRCRRSRRWRRAGTSCGDVLLEHVPTRALPARLRRAPVRLRRRDHRRSSWSSRPSSGVKAGSLIGQAGVEPTYNELLMGQDGARVVTVNSVGREIGDARRGRAGRRASRVQLTIDADVQRAAEEGFRIAGYNGSAVMLDPRNGEILALRQRADLRSERLRQRHRRPRRGAS